MSETLMPPTPTSVPLLGHGFAFSRDPFGALEEWAEHGDVVRISFPGESFFMVTEPSLIEQVLLDNQNRFTIAERQREAFAGIEDHAVTTSTGDRWKRLRKALHPAFTRDTIEQYVDRIVEKTTERIDTWEEGERIDLHREMRLLTIHIIAETLLDIDIRGNEDVVMNATDALVARSDPRRFGQLLPEWVPTPTERRFENTVRALDAYVDQCLADRREGGRDTDAPSVLLAAHDRGDLTFEEVRHNMVALLLAGSDTSALALTYSWYLLSNHPDVHESLVAEYETHIAPGLPDIESRADLERTQNVISETLRLFPPSWGFMRQTTEPVALGDYQVSAGAQLWLLPWVLHRDDRYWDDPTSFDPSRWQRASNRPDYAYFPFSGGPRHCIGMHFARLELLLALATMVGRVELDVSIDEPLTFMPALSLRPETDITATVHYR